MLGAIAANVYRMADGSQSLVLTAIHVPLALWLVIGVAYVGGDWRSGRRRMDFAQRESTAGWLVDRIASLAELADFDAVVARAQARGATVLRAVHRNPPDGVGNGPAHREIWLQDPDGYTVVAAGADGEAWQPDPTAP